MPIINNSWYLEILPNWTRSASITRTIGLASITRTINPKLYSQSHDYLYKHYGLYINVTGHVLWHLQRKIIPSYEMFTKHILVHSDNRNFVRRSKHKIIYKLFIDFPHDLAYTWLFYHWKYHISLSQLAKLDSMFTLACERTLQRQQKMPANSKLMRQIFANEKIARSVKTLADKANYTNKKISWKVYFTSLRHVKLKTNAIILELFCYL